MAINPEVSSVAVVGPTAAEHSYVDWAAILAGATLAMAISFVLFAFGAAIGLGISSPFEGEGVTLGWFVIAAGLWFLWVQVSSFMAGAYVAGRMRRRAYDSTEHEVDVRDGLHGLLVWATGALLGAVLAALSFGGATDVAAQTGGAESVVASVTETISDVVENTAVEGADEATVGDAVGEELTNAEEARADAARRFGVLAAFITAASLLVSAAAAFFAAGVGGRHRDQGLVLPFFTRRKW